jgi:hypothetical protein
MTEAFGVVGMIAMMPPITVQTMGVIYDRTLKKTQPAASGSKASNGKEETC